MRNATTTDFPLHRRIDELFEDQVAQRPGALAVIADDRRLSYHELNTYADRIARRLRRSEWVAATAWPCCSKDRGCSWPQSSELYKAGAAYVAVDPDHAPVRRRLVLQDAEPKATIVEARLTHARATRSPWSS